MSRISPITEPEGKAKDLLDAVQEALGITPNLMRTLAQSPVALEAYLNLNTTLSHALTPKLREQIALVVAEENGCSYCASAHTALGKLAGLTDDQIALARSAQSSEAKSNAALTFAKALVAKRGKVSDNDLEGIREAGFTEGNIAEIVGHVALNVFTNYFNETAKTEIDFPIVEVPLKRVSAA